MSARTPRTVRARSPCPCRTRGAPGGALATRQHGVMGGLASWTLGGAAIQRLTERARHRTRREPRWISSNTSSGPDGRVLAHRSRHLFRRPTGCRGPPPHARLPRWGWQRRERIREGHRRRDGHEAINEAARKATQQPHPACSVTLVTHRDVLRAAITDGKRAARDPSLRVCAVISRDMMTVLPALPLALAADLLIERRAGVCWSSTSAARWTAS